MPYISEKYTTAPESPHNDTEKKAFEMLDRLGISYERVDNDVVESMEECKELDNALGAEIRKSIFLRNKKKTTLILAVLPAQKQLNSSRIEKALGTSRLSFASAELMEQYLSQTPGSASVMGLLNDEDDDVILVVDQEVADAEWFGCNSGVNTEHLKFRTKDLLERFLPAIRHRAEIVEL